jgi:exonuclease SbcD
LRFLHTADWHVGARLRGRPRLDEQRAALAALVALAESERVDAVIVAGDVFDALTPPPEAEQLVWETLLAFDHLGVTTLLVAGNHDHARRLTGLRPILERACRVRMAGELLRPADGGVVRLEVHGERAEVALLPWVSPAGILTSERLMSLDAAGQSQLFTDRLAKLVDAVGRGLDPATLHVFVGHLMAVGARLGGGERTMQCGADFALPTTAFDPAVFQYVALGHVHRAQSLPAGCPAWYAGAPIRLDFGEEEHEPVALVVELAPGLPASIRRVPLPGGRALRTLTGRLDDVLLVGEASGDAWLRVILDEPPRPGLAAEVRRRLPNAIDVRLRSTVPANNGVDDDLRSRATPRELFAAYLRAAERDDEAVRELFVRLYAARADAERLGPLADDAGGTT